MKPERKLREYRITSISPGTEDGTTQWGDHTFRVGDTFTIGGCYEPTKWERVKEWVWAHTLWYRVAKYRTANYLENLWAALCGRRDDY